MKRTVLFERLPRPYTLPLCYNNSIKKRLTGMASATRDNETCHTRSLSSILWMKQLAIRLSCQRPQLSRWLSRKRARRRMIATRVSLNAGSDSSHPCRIQRRLRQPVHGQGAANCADFRQATTSRPWLMSSIGRRTEHASQTTITLTGQHADFGKARASIQFPVRAINSGKDGSSVRQPARQSGRAAR